MHDGRVGLSILVADDQEFLRQALDRYLSARGHTVHAAANGLTAWTLYQSVRPDAVVTDLDMPGLHGWELLGNIRSLHPTVPVLVMTGLAEPGTAREAQRLGATALLAKPFPFEDLARAVEAAVPRVPPSLR
jgi:CheY-like chemotaxis protein